MDVAFYSLCKELLVLVVLVRVVHQVFSSVHPLLGRENVDYVSIVVVPASLAIPRILRFELLFFLLLFFNNFLLFLLLLMADILHQVLRPHFDLPGTAML